MKQFTYLTFLNVKFNSNLKSFLSLLILFGVIVPLLLLSCTNKDESPNPVETDWRDKYVGKWVLNLTKVSRDDDPNTPEDDYVETTTHYIDTIMITKADGSNKALDNNCCCYISGFKLVINQELYNGANDEFTKYPYTTSYQTLLKFNGDELDYYELNNTIFLHQYTVTGKGIKVSSN